MEDPEKWTTITRVDAAWDNRSTLIRVHLRYVKSHTFEKAYTDYSDDKAQSRIVLCTGSVYITLSLKSTGVLCMPFLPMLFPLPV